MNISPRLGRIFLILLEQEEGKTVSADEMARRIRISRRTLFRELECARQALAPYGATLQTRPGLALTGNRESLAAALGARPMQVLNRDERQDLLLYELLRRDGGEKLVVYASRFQVSEATISHDLEDLRQRLAGLGLTIGRNGEITGSEEARRKAMSGLMHENVEYKTVDYLDPDTALDQLFKGSAILSLLDQDILKRLLSLLSSHRQELNLIRFEQNSYIGLVIHLVIALERIQAGDPCRQQLVGLPEMEDSRREAGALVRLLEKEFHVTFPDTETDAVALHLRGSKLNRADGLADAGQEEILDLARCFIEGFPPQEAARLGMDAQFIQGLVSHLEPTVIRMRNGLPIYNPLLDHLKTQYQDLFEQTRQAAAAMEAMLQARLPDEEIGFLTMHVGACFERTSRQNRRTIRAAVVCASGIGVSSLLSARLERAFTGQITLEALSAAQAREREDIELFITTFQVVGLPGRVLKVSPLLPGADLKRIQEQVSALQLLPAPAAARTEDLDMELERLQDILEAARMMQEGIRFVTVSSRYEPAALIHQAAQILEGEAALLEQDLWKREQLGAVLAPAEGFALFHARSQGTEKIQAALLYPEQGTFDNGLRGVLVTVLPESGSRQMQHLLSRINRSMAQDEIFREALLSGNQAAADQALDALLVRFVRRCGQ